MRKILGIALEFSVVVAIVICIVFLVRTDGEVTASESPLVMDSPLTYAEVDPLGNCLAGCVMNYEQCHEECEALHGRKETDVPVENMSGGADIEVDGEAGNDSTLENTPYTLNVPSPPYPVFILSRRWPIMSPNSGALQCTYFTDGSRYCR